MNSFISPASHGVLEALARIGAIEGVTHVDLNYPEHFETVSVPQMRKALEKHGLKMNALNMRFKRPFLRGAYANPSAEIRREAEALTEKAAQVCRDMGGDLIIIWLAYDGYDYAMQMDYPQAWNQLVQTLCTLCRDRRLRFAIEYKPYEERGFSLLDSYGTTSCLIRETGAQNLGMVLDFCHMLMKKENPAFAASLLLSQGKLYGVHLNDGEGHCDNGFMVGMCHPWKTLELLYYLKKHAYEGVVYFDTFPVRESAEDELAANIAMFEQLWALLDASAMQAIAQASANQDGMAVQRIFRDFLANGAWRR
ncbi:MAG TPA: sugar phosphate isomerase/epimerase [Candidatus Avichristensenella intestinipullorum]|uniref:Sugar phosphate isomerase/epimerase n=1 Tax=Candidatus Avichristensenella intestinipullorum TaxID=2840693 RepID=A0A9D0YWE5_9FIRM|nr:sugar phosphate isomerase/epimerase [Candidatus Avichristensenella intestinipullorum]